MGWMQHVAMHPEMLPVTNGLDAFHTSAMLKV
jgi:hypothetical protein